MALQADSNGELTTIITIPEGIPAGAKDVVVQGASGLQGAATYVGRGTIVDRELRRVATTGVFRQPVDPLAQTFTLPESHSVSGVEFHFETIGSAVAANDVYVQIRGVSLGIPTNEVLAEGRIKFDDIVLHPAYARAEWSPVVLDTNATYAIVLLTDDPDHAVAVAELGKFDQFQQSWVTGQPYPIGVLLSSSNAQTWTPHQSVDLKFRLLAADYLTTTRRVQLATIPVTDATDIAVLAGVERPTSDCDVTFELELDDGVIIEVVEFQGVQLGEPYTGDVQVFASLAGTSKFSPTVYEGVQLVVGTIHNSDDYITRAIPCWGETILTVHIDYIIPPGAGVAVDYEMDDSGTWTSVPFIESEPLGDGKVDAKYQITGLAATEHVRVRITLSGSTSARPFCENLRCFTT